MKLGTFIASKIISFEVLNIEHPLSHRMMTSYEVEAISLFLNSRHLGSTILYFMTFTKR
jgi:hypothetical protein